MRLQEALNKSVEEFGVEVLNEPRLINVINDFHGFEDMPSARIILQFIQDKCFINNIIDAEACELNSKIENIAYKLNRNYGFEKEISKIICSAIWSSIHPEVICQNTFDDRKYSWTDEFGVVFNKDGSKLLETTTNIESYTVPEGVKVICVNAFCNLKTIKSIQLPKSLTHIGALAFYGCESLLDINVGEGVKYIGGAVFSHCYNLKQVVLPKSLKIIDTNPFSDCGVESVICKSDSYTIEDSFIITRDKTKLIAYFGSKKVLEIPHYVKQIGQCAFSHTKMIENVKLNANISSIGDSAFTNCESLKQIIMTDNISYIGDAAFEDCKSLFSITIPKFVKKIEDWTFAGCVSLKNILFQGKVNEIGFLSLSGCNSLANIRVPKGTKFHYEKILPQEYRRMLMEY